MTIPFNKKWIIIEKEDYTNYLFVVGVWEGFTIKNPEFGFTNARFLSAEYINTACNLFITLDSYQETSQGYFKTLFTKPKIWDNLHRGTKYYSDELIKISKKIKSLDIKRLTNKQLLKWLDLFQKYQVESHDRRGPMFLIEARDNLFTKYLQNYLTERVQDLKIKNISPLEAFQILTTSTKKSNWMKEKEQLIEIALIKDRKRQQKALRLHAQKYEWLEYGLKGKILDFDYFKKRLNKIKRQNAKKLLKKTSKEIQILKNKQRKSIKTFKIHKLHQRLFKIARDSIYWRLYSKDSQFFGYFCIEDLLREIGRRCGLTLEQVKFLAPKDYQEVLLKNKDFSDITNERMKYSLHFADQGKTTFYSGKKAKKIRKKLKFIELTKKVRESEEIKGQPAYQGKAKGAVKIINASQEMVKMHRGNILVSHMTNPDIVSVMKQARAIVTDLGGITCHAAIVARELKLPCIIGTKIATKVLKDGDKVKVDANKGIIKKL